jgi:hypothetical protein
VAVVIDGRSLPSGDDPHTLTLTDDEVLVLFEMFERLEENNELKFAHPAEWAALGRLTGQFEATLWQLFGPVDWETLLFEARTRRAQGFEGRVPGLGHVRVEPDGQVVPTPDPDA